VAVAKFFLDFQIKKTPDYRTSVHVMSLKHVD